MEGGTSGHDRRRRGALWVDTGLLKFQQPTPCDEVNYVVRGGSEPRRNGGALLACLFSQLCFGVIGAASGNCR